MRRKARIEEILAKIKAEWLKHPDQRLGQLLINYFQYPRKDIFGVEDDHFGVSVFEQNSYDALGEIIENETDIFRIKFGNIDKGRF